MMIRANKREEVLSAGSMWKCTSCYNCIVRCPRELPITHIMHGLAHYAKRLGLAPKEEPTLKFSQLFWDNMMVKGRVNELKLSMRLYFMNGLKEGIKTALKMKAVGWGMMRAKRINPLDMVAGHAVKDLKGFQAIIKKAQQLEAERVGKDTSVK